MPIANPQFVPLFANIEGIITVVIVLVSIIGWLVNLINENAKKNQAGRPPNPAPGGGGGAAANDDRFQQEIDDFLKQVGGQPQGRRHDNRPAPAPAQVETVDIEVVPERELWEREREERRQRELSSLADRHVETHIGNSIQEKVEQDIDVVADLGESKATAPPPRRVIPKMDPGAIVSMLRDRDGVRKAIIVNEVLQRRTLRR